MAKSISLALYLASKARQDRATRRGDESNPLTEQDKLREAERLGTYRKPRPKGPLIWFHTGRDPQAIAIRELANRLRSERDDFSFLLTTDAEKRIDSKPYMTSQFAPDEALQAIRRFLDHWKPDISVWSEPDPRMALITESARRQIPLILVDAGTSRPDPQGRRWWRGMSGTLLSGFQHVLTGTPQTAANMRKLGADPATLEIKGFLQEGPAALSCNETDRTAIAREIGARPVWLAAHISESERPAILAAHRQALRRAHRLLLVVVPQDPEMGPGWARRLRSDGQTVGLRSTDGDEVDSQTQVYIADTENEMGLWYRMAPISFLGQSLTSGGGINPYEAAALGSAILHGPNIDAHSLAYARLASAKATRVVRDGNGLGDAVDALQSPDVVAAMAHGAWQVVSTGAEVTDRAMDLILTTLDAHETA